MRSPFKLKKAILFSERGAALALFVLTVPVLLGLATLAVDLGGLYLARDRMNALGRSGAAVLLNMRSLQGWAPLVCNTTDPGGLGYTCGGAAQAGGAQLDAILVEVDNHIRNSILAMYPQETTSNLNKYLQYLSGQSSTWTSSTGTSPRVLDGSTIDLLSPDESVRLQVRFAPKTLLVGKLSSIFGSSACQGPSTGDLSNDKNRCWVQSSVPQAGQLNPADIYLLLDYSGSMANTTTGSTDTKEVALEKAVASFIDFFNPKRDRISVIPYSTGVRRGSIWNLANFDSTSALLPIKTDIQALTTSGQTNACDALVTAIQRIQANEGNNPNPRFVVFFTDGAPNVYRLGFCGTGNTPCSAAAPGLPVGSNNDWYGWEVQWGQRQVYAPPLTAVAPTGASSAANYYGDPFFGVPLIRQGAGAAPTVTFPNPAPFTAGSITLDQTGTHRFNTTSINSYTPPYSLVFNTLTSAANNYKWSGPSYLVNAASDISGQTSLVDRLTVPLSPAPTTCGPPSGNGAELFQFNHSRYFASRVLDRTWGIDTIPNPALSGRTLSPRARTGLSTIFAAGAPVALNFVPNPAIAGLTPPVALPTTSPGCLNSMNAFIPGSNPQANLYAGNDFLSNAADASINFGGPTLQGVGEIVKSAELPYYCSIRAADYLRSQGIVVFVVGLGDPASAVYGDTCNDPMQNALDANTRKDYFLQRLAFAPESLANPAAFVLDPSMTTWRPQNDFRYQQGGTTSLAIACTNHPLNGIAVNIGYGEDWNSTRPSGRSPSGHGFTPRELGAYYPAKQANQLAPIFGKIAKQILLRLSQ